MGIMVGSPPLGIEHQQTDSVIKSSLLACAIDDVANSIYSERTQGIGLSIHLS